MKLYNAARMGDTLLAADTYNPATTLYVGYDPLSYSKIDGVAVKKRMVSAAPSVSMPLRGVLTIDGQTYLVGHGAPDYWKGSEIRVNYVIQGADGLANLSSIASILADGVPDTAYAALVFSKYIPDTNDTSKLPPQYQIFLAGSEETPADSLVELNSKWYLIKQSYISTSGLRIALANELDTPVFETIPFGSGTYDPYTDSVTTTNATTKIMRVKWSEHFVYLSKASKTFERGDIQVFISKTKTPKPSDTLTLSDGTWRILSVQDDMGVWSCHARRV